MTRNVDRDTVRALATLGAATVSMQLLKTHGIRSHWMRGPRPLSPGMRVAGPAFTFRFVPAREDLATPESYKGPRSIRAAIEQVPTGAVVVIDQMGETGAGSLGDILVTRLARRGAAGIVSDGAMRDVDGIREVDLPVFCAGAAAPPSIARLYFAGWQEPIACGGVAVLPGDVVVGDADGVVVVPAALAGRIVEDGREQERFERFALMKMRAGAPVEGIYPPSVETLAQYRRWVEEGEGES